MAVSRLDLDPAVEFPLEWLHLPLGRPHLQLRVGLRDHLQPAGRAVVGPLDPFDDLRVAAIEALGEPQQRGANADEPARCRGQRAESLV